MNVPQLCSTSSTTNIFAAPMCLSCFETEIPNWSSCSCVTDVPSKLRFKHYWMQTERYKWQLLDNNDYLCMCLWPCIQFKNQQILNYFTTVKAAFLHLYILDKGIFFLLAISFTELSSDAWSGDFRWLQLIHQNKNSLDAVLKSSCSAVIINTSKIVF